MKALSTTSLKEIGPADNILEVADTGSAQNGTDQISIDYNDAQGPHRAVELLEPVCDE